MLYRGIHINEYEKILQEYNIRVFALLENRKQLFDTQPSLGQSLLWYGSWNALHISKNVVDRHLDEGIPMFNALIEELKLLLKPNSQECELLDELKKDKVKKWN